MSVLLTSRPTSFCLFQDTSPTERLRRTPSQEPAQLVRGHEKATISLQLSDRHARPSLRTPTPDRPNCSSRASSRRRQPRPGPPGHLLGVADQRLREEVAADSRLGLPAPRTIMAATRAPEWRLSGGLYRRCREQSLPPTRPSRHCRAGLAVLAWCSRHGVPPAHCDQLAGDLSSGGWGGEPDHCIGDVSGSGESLQWGVVEQVFDLLLVEHLV